MEKTDLDRGYELLREDPNYTGAEDSGFGMSDDEMLRRMRGLVQLDLARHRLLGLPIAKYDAASGIAYLEYPDGRREYVTESGISAGPDG